MVVTALRNEGYAVYDFKNPAPGNHGFQWTEIDPAWQSWTPEEYVEALNHPVAQRGFDSDMNALRSCDICVLVLPCNCSAHLEAGWAAGAGKKVFILVRDSMEPELMYKMTDRTSLEQLVSLLRDAEQADDAAIEQMLNHQCVRCRHHSAPPPDRPDPCDSCVKRVNSGIGWTLTNFSREYEERAEL